MKKFRQPLKPSDSADIPVSAPLKSHNIDKKKLLTWTASALAILIAPVAVFAWSVDSTHLSNTATNPMVKLDETAADSTGSSNSTPTTSTANVPPVTDENSSTTDNTTTGSHTNTSTTNVTVNNQSIPVPSNGTTNQTVVSSNGQPTQVVIQHSSSSNGTSTNNNNTDVSISSTSNSSESQ